MVMENNKEKRFNSPEFALVMTILFILLILVIIVLYVPIKFEITSVNEAGIAASQDGTRISDILDYRKTILTVIITAFGVWVGAGVALFFGRENLAIAQKGLLSMKELSPREQLRKASIKDTSLPMSWLVKKSDEISKVVSKLKDYPEYWFITVVDEEGSLITVLSEEIIWRYIGIFSEDGQKKYSDIIKDKIEDVLNYIEEDRCKKDKEKKGLDVFTNIHVLVNSDTTIGAAYDLMIRQGKRLALVKDAKNKPISFITTIDVLNVVL